MRREALRALALSAAFALTGVAVGTVGASLPAVMARFGVGDRGAGVVMLLAWGGSTCGVMLCRGRVDSSALRGLALAAVALGGLCVLQSRMALGLFAIYGVGLGITMTSISVLRVAGMPEEMRRRTLNRLNMLWALGACASPLLAAHALETLRVARLFGGLAIFFGLCAIVLLLAGNNTDAGWDDAQGSEAYTMPPWSLCVFAALAVGVESALGGWLTTYAGRTAHGTGLTVSAVTAFWAGLLLSRTVHSSARAAGWSIRGHIVLAVAAIGLLLAVPRGNVFLLLALAAGCGLGPLYPFALAKVLTQYRPRAIFLIAGAGSAVVPWATGQVSGWTGSLRMGLLLPLVLGVVLIAVGETVRGLGRGDGVEAG